MGNLNKFNIQSYIEKYKTLTFVETGSGEGKGIEVARKHDFYQIFSTEILESQVFKLNAYFSKDPKICIMKGNSFSILEKILPKIKTNILFWLDAHYPGADLGLAKYDDEKDIDIRLPLEKEIETIFNLRKEFQDVILCDDLRIYENGPFESKNMDEIGCGNIKKYGLEFLNKLNNKYIITKHYQDEGYLEITPR